MAPGEYRLQFLVDGEVKNETSFIIKDEEDEAPLEFKFGEAAVTAEDNYYVLTVPYTYNGYFSINAVLSVNNAETNKSGSVDYEKQTVTFDYLYGDEYNPGDTLTVTATVEGQEFPPVTATVPVDNFRLYPSNETARIALFRESESAVLVSVPIERIFGVFTDFDVTVTKDSDSTKNSAVWGQRKEDGLFSIEFYINNVTSGDYTLEIVPSGKATPKVQCKITVPNEIPVGKRIYLSPKRM